MMPAFEVEAHAVGKQDHHGLAMGDVADAAERMADRMHDAHHSVREAGACEQAAERERGAHIKVPWLFARAHEIFGDERDRLACQRIGNGVLLDGGIGLDRVGERVDARRGSELRRQRSGEQRVKESNVRHELIRSVGKLLVRFFIGDDRNERNFAARACGSGNGDERVEVVLQDLGALQLSDVAVADRDRGSGTLRGVDDRTATERDEAVAPFLFVDGCHIVHYGKRRVGRHLVVESEGKARFGQAMDRMVGDAERHEIRIGYHERFGHAHLNEDNGQLVERMFAADDAGRAVEFKSVHKGSP